MELFCLFLEWTFRFLLKLQQYSHRQDSLLKILRAFRFFRIEGSVRLKKISRNAGKLLHFLKLRRRSFHKKILQFLLFCVILFSATPKSYFLHSALRLYEHFLCFLLFLTNSFQFQFRCKDFLQNLECRH